MPHKRPNGPDFFACRRRLREQAVAATTRRDHWTPPPESPSESAYGEPVVAVGAGTDGDRTRPPTAAFSDFHGSAARPAAGATLPDPAFVTGRFATPQSRRPVPFEESAHV